MFEYQATAKVMDSDGNIKDVLHIFESEDQMGPDDVLDEVMLHYNSQYARLMECTELEI